MHLFKNILYKNFYDKKHHADDTFNIIYIDKRLKIKYGPIFSDAGERIFSNK